jgi:hypothetical protein
MLNTIAVATLFAVWSAIVGGLTYATIAACLVG